MKATWDQSFAFITAWLGGVCDNLNCRLILLVDSSLVLLNFMYVERPEEAYDHRTLYERLKEQKDRKQEEFMEQLKFSKYI